MDTTADKVKHYNTQVTKDNEVMLTLGKENGTEEAFLLSYDMSVDIAASLYELCDEMDCSEEWDEDLSEEAWA